MRARHSEANTAGRLETPIHPDLRALLTFLVAWVAVCVLVFLGASDFFSTWSGQAVSVRASTPDPAVWHVLVADEAGSVEVDWPAEVVEGLGLPIDPMAIPPSDIPSERPHTSKSRFQLHFLVEEPEGEGWRTVPTTSPRSLGIAIVVFFVGLGVRNMVWAGSPVSITRREAYLPPEQATSGSPAPSKRGPPKKRPPPPRRRRGPRR